MRFLLITSLGASLCSGFCLQGCCGMRLVLPSNTLTLSTPQTGALGVSDTPAIQINHPNSYVECCGCDGVDPPHSNGTNGHTITYRYYYHTLRIQPADIETSVPHIPFLNNHKPPSPSLAALPPFPRQQANRSKQPFVYQTAADKL
jgi:hypothetical protein